jgi:hemoglobin-like flavoprotein
MQEQGQKLLQMIDVAVGQLNHLDRLVPTLQQLGQRHAAYGVLPAHYETVGAELLDTLARGLGDEFTKPVRTAWASVYGTMAQVMTETAYRQADYALPTEA